MELDNKSLKKTSTALQKQLDQVRKEDQREGDQLKAKVRTIYGVAESSKLLLRLTHCCMFLHQIISLDSELCCERVARQVETQALREEWRREVEALSHREVNVTMTGHEEPIYEEPPDVRACSLLYMYFY